MLRKSSNGSSYARTSMSMITVVSRLLNKIRLAQLPDTVFTCTLGGTRPETRVKLSLLSTTPLSLILQSVSTFVTYRLPLFHSSCFLLFLSATASSPPLLICPVPLSPSLLHPLSPPLLSSLLPLLSSHSSSEGLPHHIVNVLQQSGEPRGDVLPVAGGAAGHDAGEGLVHQTVTVQSAHVGLTSAERAGGGGSMLVKDG